MNRANILSSYLMPVLMFDKNLMVLAHSNGWALLNCLIQPNKLQKCSSLASLKSTHKYQLQGLIGGKFA